MDWNLPAPGPQAYYMACLKALGRMAGMYKAKQLHPDIELMFPMVEPSPYMPMDCWGQDDDSFKIAAAKIDSMIKFVSNTAKKVYPKDITGLGYLTQFKEELLHVMDYQQEIGIYLSMDPDYVTLTHSNLQIDNAFFWRDNAGELNAGLLDWGVLGCASFSSAIYGGCISGASVDIIVNYLDEFIQVAIDSYAGNGGPRLDQEKMKKMVYFNMLQSAMGLPSNVTQVLKNTKAAEWADISDWMDPKLVGRFQTRVHCTSFKLILQLWKACGLYEKFRAWLTEMGLPESKRSGAPPIRPYDEADSAMPDLRDKQWSPVPAGVWASFPRMDGDHGGRPTGMKEFKAVVEESRPGEYWGIKFPCSPAALKEAGPAWLTEAMHTAGTLSPDNAVTEFVEFEAKAEDVTIQDAENAKWGGAGCKVLLKVKYKNGPEPHAGEGLFVKMPHTFTGKNERYKNSVTSYPMDWGEVTFYNIFGGRFGQLPFKSPTTIFVDMCRATTNFIIIVERIPYGKAGTKDVKPGEWFPAPEKYRDWALPDNGIDLYYAQCKALAHFFGWHFNTRKTTSQIEEVFMDQGSWEQKKYMMDMVAGAGPYMSPERDAAILDMMTKNPETVGMLPFSSQFNPAAAKQFADMGMDFVQSAAPQAFPKECLEKKYIAKLVGDLEAMGPYCCEIMFYLSYVPEYFALTHPNAQVDNAFYWKDMQGALQCGLLDWGGVQHGSIPNCLGNGWIGMEPETMTEHEEKLVKVFIDEYEKVTGFSFDFDDLMMGTKLAHAHVLYGCFANVGMLYRIQKKAEWGTIKGRTDPKIDENFLCRCYFVQMVLIVKGWGMKCCPKPYFDKFIARLKIPKK
jgi:hypothetical protein